MNQILFQNLVVCLYGFKLNDGSIPVKDPRELVPTQARTSSMISQSSGFPYGDPELDGFVEWWETDPHTNYGPDYLHDHRGGWMVWGSVST